MGDPGEWEGEVWKMSDRVLSLPLVVVVVMGGGVGSEGWRWRSIGSDMADMVDGSGTSRSIFRKRTDLKVQYRQDR